MRIRTILNQEDMEFIKDAHGQLSSLEISLHLRADLYVVHEALKTMGAPRKIEFNTYRSQLVRPPAIYSND